MYSKSDCLSYKISESRCLRILKSGFVGLYHVIDEDGEYDISLHEEMTKNRILREFNIDIEKDFKNLKREKKLNRIIKWKRNMK